MRANVLNVEFPKEMSLPAELKTLTENAGKRLVRGSRVENDGPMEGRRWRWWRKNLERSDRIQGRISELEHVLLAPVDEDISTTSLAKNARDEGGHSKVGLVDTPRGKERGR